MKLIHIKNYIKYFLNKSIYKIFNFEKDFEIDFIKKLEKDYGKKNNLAEIIAEEVINNGFIKLPSLDEEYLNKITKEYNHVMNCYKDLNIDYQEDEGIVARLVPLWRLNPSKFKYSFSFFRNKFFFDIAKNFYLKKNIKNFSFNNEAFFHKTIATKNPLSGDYHYDVRQTLKFWLYMNDINDKNGPMSVEKGSAKRNQLHKLEVGHQILSEKRGHNKVDVVKENCFKLIGKKGSIFIHDTDSSHRANNVYEGYERNIIRAHTWKQNSFIKKFI